MPEERSTRGLTWKAQHDAIAIPHEEVSLAVVPARRRGQLKDSPVERMCRISHSDASTAVDSTAGIVRVLEGSINNGYRSTIFRTRR